MQDDFFESMKKKLSAGEKAAGVTGGDVRKAAERLTPEQAKRLEALANDPAALSAFLNAPGVRKLLEKLGGEGAVVAMGMSVFRPEEDRSIQQVFERADRRMYERKRQLKEM